MFEERALVSNYARVCVRDALRHAADCGRSRAHALKLQDVQECTFAADRDGHAITILVTALIKTTSRSRRYPQAHVPHVVHGKQAFRK